MVATCCQLVNALAGSRAAPGAATTEALWPAGPTAGDVDRPPATPPNALSQTRFESHARHGDDRGFRQSLLKLVILRISFGPAQPPAAIVNHDIYVIGVVEGRRRAIERRIVEDPFRYSSNGAFMRKSTVEAGAYPGTKRSPKSRAKLS